MANFSLFFILSVIIAQIVVINAQNAYALPSPSAPPPEDNTPELLKIDESNQIKSGALRFGTDDQTSPYNYQLEVLGSGARSTQGVIDNELSVNAAAQTLFVDAASNRVCIGSCISDAQSVLQLANGRMRVAGLDEPGVQAVSSGAEALYGYGATYGVQGVSNSSTGYGMWAVSSLSTALEGVHTAGSPQYSAVAGLSTTGIGVYGSSLNLSNRWAGYFTGLLESNEIVSAAKVLRTTEPESLIPYTSGQIAAQFFPELFPRRVATDGKWLWVGQGGNYHDDLLRVDKATGEVTARYALGPAWDLIYDQANGYMWQASTTYPGKIGRVNIASGTAELRSVLDADDQGTCPYGFIVQDSNDPDILWALHAGGDCFGRDYHDRLEKLRISDYTVDGSTWEPIARYDIEHTESMTAPYSQGPRAIAFDANTNSIWVAFQDNDAVYKISALDPGAGDTLISPADYTRYAVPGPTDLFFDAARNYIWASAEDNVSGNNGAYYINIGSGVVSSRIPTYSGNVGFSGPKAITVEGSNVWVATNTSSQTGYVDRFNADTPGAVTHFATNQQASYHDILFDPTVNRVWVPSWYGRTIVGLDATSGAVMNTFDYSKKDFSVLYHDNTYVWLGRGSDLWKVRARDGFVAFQVTLGAGMTEGFNDGNYFWVTARDADTVYKVNLYSGAVVCSKVFATGTKPVSIAYDGRSYWVSGQGTGEIINLSNTCVELSRTDVSNAADSLGKIIYNGSYLWAVSSAENGIVNMNPASRQAVLWTNSIVGLNPVDIFYDNVHYWVANRGTNSVTSFYLTNDKRCSLDQTMRCSIDTDCGINGGCFALPQAVGTFPTGSEPIGVAFDGTYVWTANYASQSMSRLLAADPANRLDIPLTFAPQSLEFDGSYLWSTGSGSQGSAGVVKLFAGAGDGDHSFAETLSLQSTTVPTWQRGSYSISGDARVGTNATVDGDLITTGNQWGDRATGDYIFNNALMTWTTGPSLPGSGYNFGTVIQARDGKLYGGAATAAGATMYVSSDYGVTWTSTGGPFTVNTVYSLLEGSDGLIYAGTGAGTMGNITRYNPATGVWSNLRATGGVVMSLLEDSGGRLYAGYGFFSAYVDRSTDHGASWTTLGPLAGASGIYDLIQSPYGEIYAATGGANGDVMVSSDFAATWTNTGNLAGATTVYDLEWTSADTLFAGAYTGTNGNVIFRSTDRAASWALSGTPASNIQRIQSVIEANDGSIWIGGAATGTPYDNVFRSTDNGSTWVGVPGTTANIPISKLLNVGADPRYFIYTVNGLPQMFEGEFAKLNPGTYNCPQGHFVTNVAKNEFNQVILIECRPL